MSELCRQIKLLTTKILFASFGLFSLVACSAQTPPLVPTNWKNECVGRMQLSLPDDADMSAYSFDRMEERYKQGSNRSYFTFPDGQDAEYTRLDYSVVAVVSHPLTPLQIEVLLTNARTNAARAKAYTISKKKGADANALVFEEFSVAPLVGQAHRVNTTFEASFMLGNHVLLTRSSGRGDNAAWIKDEHKPFDMLVKGIAPRAFGLLPKAPGVCMPYAFFQDDGLQSRAIAVTYRLKEHPDVTILLDDKSAVEAPSGQDPSKFTPEYKTEFFWRQQYQDPVSGRNLANGTGEIKFNNRKGIATFLELTRKDKTIDYGYSVVANGDPNAKEDTPDLMMYVIRDAKNAIAKGKEPIGKDEFLKLAQTIAASVKHRPVK